MKVIGVFKFENGANIIVIFIGLRPKMYTFKMETKYEKDKKDDKIKEIEMRIDEEKKAKGVKKMCDQKNFNT